MDPDVIESVADIVESLATPFVVMVVTVGAYFTARVWRTQARSADLESVHDKLDTLLSHQESLQRELTEVSDRIEFAERLLVKGEEA